MSAGILRVGDFVRRVVDGLLRGDCRGKFLRAPGRMTHVARSTCAACARSTMPCLVVPVP